jgi:ABC-type ATPase involved in cell division
MSESDIVCRKFGLIYTDFKIIRKQTHQNNVPCMMYQSEMHMDKKQLVAPIQEQMV